jgi:glutamate--cysteine ligase
MAKDFDNSFVKFVRAQSVQTQKTMLELPFSADLQSQFEAMTRQSIAEQKAIEAADTLPFEIYRKEYVSAERLGIGSRAPSFA